MSDLTFIIKNEPDVGMIKFTKHEANIALRGRFSFVTHIESKMTIKGYCLGFYIGDKLCSFILFDHILLNASNISIIELTPEDMPFSELVVEDNKIIVYHFINCLKIKFNKIRKHVYSVNVSLLAQVRRSSFVTFYGGLINLYGKNDKTVKFIKDRGDATLTQKNIKYTSVILWNGRFAFHIASFL